MLQVGGQHGVVVSQEASAVSPEARPNQNVKLARRCIAVRDRRGMELRGSEGYITVFTCIISTQSQTNPNLDAPVLMLDLSPSF
ncbi:hypothetical protein HBI04_028900 [Parastagonospora nodorum]|nr:hypothetical protein HBH50_106710 [Parastagonospora nodorum]KAH4088010.1 hypothetical protein HBH48_123670 [Parastagonospora nodorum]KAH4271239.1 hypothetical protein HBI03_034070 [Parastagonospora nodorum]KAH4282234.1 hypothetical protein HBI04_028900 [Parastagonospora nodorum]KAH5481041.1 hypothetical protein HBI28_025600 [Parastagonospora nodorum]